MEEMFDSMNIYKLNTNDIDSNFFHFTKRNNINSIKINGLIPKIGENAKFLEKTNKVFFVNGLDSLLILFDCWINVYEKLALFPFLYTLGSRCIRYKYFPKFIAKWYFKWVNKHSHKERAYKVFDQLLNDCILLNLDIKERIDFAWMILMKSKQEDMIKII